jgi:DNA-binding transcriptional MerR regulator
VNVSEPTSVGDDEDDLLIDDLSRRTGLTVRSLRSYQSRGLLPPPVVRGRTGYYGERHLARVEIIKDLQAQGLKLKSIAHLLDESAASDRELLRFSRRLSDLFDQRQGAVTTAADLAERFRVDDSNAASVFKKAVSLGLINDLGGGAIEEVAPVLLGAGVSAQRILSLSAPEALKVLERIRRSVDSVAELYVDLYLERVWTPFVDRGRPPEEWADIQATLEELRQLATDALLAAFEQTITVRIDDAVGAGGHPSLKRRRR